MKKKIGIFIPATLGMLTAFGPFVTDFYLPMLPDMGEYFKSSPSMVAMSLTAGIIGLAAGQILIGPLTDKYGRKRILVGSMLLFAIASLLCIMAPNMFLFNVMRAFQGFAGAGGIVISKSMATDMYTGEELSHFMAVLAAINGIAPVCAPVMGGVLSNFTNWKGVFIVLLIIGVILMICSCLLKETLTPMNRIHKNLLHVYANLFKVFRSRRFTTSTLAIMFCMFGFFAYITSSSFVLQQIYGLTPLQFSLCFAFNAIMIGLGCALCSMFKKQTTLLYVGSVNFLVSSVFVAFCLVTKMPLLLLMCGYAYLMFCFGLMQPVATAVALDSQRDHAGAASAIFGASCFVAGAVSSPLVGIGNIMFTSGLIMMSGALACLVFTLILCASLKKR